MSTGRTLVAATLVAFSLCACTALAQDEEPSLGDAARQARLQKQRQATQTKNAGNTPSTAKNLAANDSPPAQSTRVITNDELPAGASSGAYSAPVSATTANQKTGDQTTNTEAASKPHDAEATKEQIGSLKNSIASLQAEIDKLNDSIHFAPANCVSNCVQWNEHQKDKQDQVEQMKSQLEDLKKQLDVLQESARKQGFGSSVYDPE